MTTLAVYREHLAARTRLNRAFAVSLGAHALLLALLTLHHTIAPHDEGIVEISWLDPAPAAAPQPAPAPSVPEPVAATKPKPRTAPNPQPDERFLRRETKAEVEPAPQLTTANRDLVRERLANLRSSAVPEALTTASLTSGAMLAVPDAPPPTVPRGEGTALNRSTAPSRPTTALTRGPEPARSARSLAAVSTDVPRTPSAATAPASTAHRNLAGADLAGEVADRPVLSHTLPKYPEWAKDQAVEGTVTLRFTVLPDGRVKENIQVERTAGFADFDANAIAALAQWRFAPLEGNAAGEQWGTITFRYRLRG